MKSELQSKNVLVLDTVIIVLFSVFLVVANIMLVEYVNRSLNEIDQQQLDKLEQVREMTRVARRRSELMLSMYVEQDEWARDEMYMEFHGIAARFIAARDSFRQLQPEPSELLLLEKILSIISETEQFQNNIVERIHSGNLRGVQVDIARKDLPVELALLGSLETLSNAITMNARDKRKQAKERYQKLVLLFEAGSVLIILLITMTMMRSLKRVGAIEKSLLDQTQSLSREAALDPLTGIYNRRWMKHKIDQLFGSQNGQVFQHALLCIDLDGFKPINDLNGHVVGDQYLVQFCREVASIIRHGDTFCRMGGDEFAVLLENCGLEDASKVAWNIVNGIGKLTIIVDGKPLSTTCSIGLYQMSVTVTDFNEIIRRADALCYQAKREGKNRVVASEAPQEDSRSSSSMR